jgi:hypothetical protein
MKYNKKKILIWEDPNASSISELIDDDESKNPKHVIHSSIRIQSLKTIVLKMAKIQDGRIEK